MPRRTDSKTHHPVTKSLIEACMANITPEINKYLKNVKDQRVLKDSIMYCIDRLNLTSAIDIANKINKFDIMDIKIFCLVFKKKIMYDTPIYPLIDILIGKFAGELSTILIWAISCGSVDGSDYIQNLIDVQMIDKIDNHYKVVPLIHAIALDNTYIAMVIIQNVQKRDSNIFKAIDLAILIDAICASVDNTDPSIYDVLMKLYLARTDRNDATDRQVIFNTICNVNYYYSVNDKMIADFFKLYKNYVLSILYSSISTTADYPSLLLQIRYLHNILVFDFSINHTNTGIPLLCYIAIPGHKCLTEPQTANAPKKFIYDRPVIDTDIQLPPHSTTSAQYQTIIRQPIMHHKLDDGLELHAAAETPYISSDQNDDKKERKEPSDRSNDVSHIMDHDLKNIPINVVNNFVFKEWVPDYLLNFHNVPQVDWNPKVCGEWLIIHYLDYIYSKFDQFIDPSVDLNYIFYLPPGLVPDSIQQYITQMLDGVRGDPKRAEKAVSMLRLLQAKFDQYSGINNYPSFIFSSVYILKSLISMKYQFSSDFIHEFLLHNSVDREVLLYLLNSGFMPTESMINNTIKNYSVGFDGDRLYYEFIENMAVEIKKWDILDPRTRKGELYQAKNRWYGEQTNQRPLDRRLYHKESPDVHFITAHGQIDKDSYFCLPPTIGIWVLAKRGEAVGQTNELKNVFMNNDKLEQYIKKYEGNGITYYAPGSIIQNQTLSFTPSQGIYYRASAPNISPIHYMPYPAHYMAPMGIITRHTCHRKMTNNVSITDTYIQADGKNIIPIVANNVNTFLFNTIDYDVVRTYELYCNDTQLFTNDELWNIYETKYISLSDIIYRMHTKGIKGKIFLTTCRSGNIHGADLHIQACREFAKKHGDEKLEGVNRMISARRNSLGVATYNFYEQLQQFMKKMSENSSASPQYHKNKLYIGDIELEVPATIMNRYRAESQTSNVKYIEWKFVKGKHVRVINSGWYREFERNIMRRLNIFIEVMDNRIKGCLPIHTVEYCRLFSLINRTLPYISTEALVCLEKRDYSEICMYV